MKQVQGDLIAMALEGKFDVIVHGCNCFHTMGGGIARTIREQFPEAYEADLKTVYGSKDKLGQVSSATITLNEKGKFVEFAIVNAYTQFETSRGEDVFEYDSFEYALEQINNLFPDARIGMPEIGCGLAGGDKKRIMGLIEAACDELLMDITVVEYQP